MKRMHQVLFLPLAALALAACESQSGKDSSFKISATRGNVVAFESTTVLVTSENTQGTHPAVEWTTTLGRIAPVKEGMLNYRPDTPSALFTSDKAGTADVTATLKTDDGKTVSDTVHIEVEALR